MLTALFSRVTRKSVGADDGVSEALLSGRRLSPRGSAQFQLVRRRQRSVLLFESVFGAFRLSSHPLRSGEPTVSVSSGGTRLLVYSTAVLWGYLDKLVRA